MTPNGRRLRSAAVGTLWCPRVRPPEGRGSVTRHVQPQFDQLVGDSKVAQRHVDAEALMRTCAYATYQSLTSLRAQRTDSRNVTWQSRNATLRFFRKIEEAAATHNKAS